MYYYPSFLEPEYAAITTYASSECKPGLKVLCDGDPCVVVSSEFVKPGKGQAFVRMRLRNLKNGRLLDRTFRSNEGITAADVSELELQFLYKDGQLWHFMDPESYEQHAAAVEETVARWLKEGAICSVILWNGQVISVAPPNIVQLRIAETGPGVRGDTESGGNKEAVLETGVRLRVPLFLEEGEVIRVDTRTDEYIGRE